MKRRIMCFLAVLMACFAIWSVSAGAQEPENSLMVLYIPLDNRPFNYERTVLMAQGLDISLLMPEEDLFATKLDGQEYNKNGTQYGDRGALYQFIQDHADEADVLIISLDQLLSGGLMSSRCIENMEPIPMPDGTTVTEYEMLDYLGELAETKDIYVIDSVLRFATSNEFAGFGGSDGSITRTYCRVPRPLLEENELSVERILQNYPLAENGKPAYMEAGFADWQLQSLTGDTGENGAYEMQPGSLLDRYLKIRERKLRLVDYALRTFRGKEHAFYILGVDDSSGGNTIHTNEIAYYKTLMDGDDQIFSAMDGLMQTAFAQAYIREVQGQGVRVCLEYFGSSPAQTGTFNYIEVEQMAEETVIYHGAQLVTEQPDISFLVYCAMEDSRKGREEIQRLVDKINENEKNHIPTILLDLSKNERDLMRQTLATQVHMGKLLAYNGNAEATVQVNLVLGQGIARYLALKQPGYLEEDAQESYVKALLWSYLDEYFRTTGGSAYMSQYLGAMGFVSNMGNLSEEMKTKIHAELTEQVRHSGEILIKNFMASGFVSNLAPYETGIIRELEIESCDYPWLRQFEFACVIEAQIREAPQVAFTDVDPERYYYGPMQWALRQDLVRGVTEDSFAPFEACDRAMMVTLLWRMAGSPEPRGENPFTDVSPDRYFYRAVLWAAEEGIVVGMTDTAFEPFAPCDRAMAVTFLWRMAGRPATQTAGTDFRDLSPERYYWDGVCWAWENGIAQGLTGECFGPEETCQRGQIVTFLYRLACMDILH